MKRLKGIALAALAAVSLGAIGAFTVGCGGTQDEPSVEISDTLRSAATDLHLKKGAQISVFLPDGVSVDTRNVNVNAAGRYEITYKENGESIVKTAFVYDTPTFHYSGGEWQETRSLAYAEANQADFLNAEDFGVTATDTFGKKLKIKATPDKLYLGKYGDYTVTYVAQDAAGNEITATVKYTVTGETAPQATGSTADVLDETFSVAIDFGGQTLTEVAFDDIALKGEYYKLTETGITFDASLIGELGIKAKSEYSVLLKTDAWCAETTVSFVDEMPSELNDFTCFNYIYLPGEKIKLPVPMKENRQGYEIFYAINGNEVNIDERNGVVMLDANEIGEYSLTAMAKQDGKADVVRETTFKICTQEEYDRIIAPCNTQFTGDFTTRSSNWGTFTYDNEMNAYRRDVIWNEGDGHSAVMLASGGRALNNMLSEYSKYPYVALELCFEGQIGVDFYSFAFYFNGGAGKDPIQMVFSSVQIYDEDGYGVLHDDMQGGEWYTVYVPVTECIADYAGWGYYFMTQMSRTEAPPPAEGKTGFKYTDYWVRNIRFEYEKNEVAVQDGYIYEVDETKNALLPKADEGYQIVSAPQGVTVVNGNLVSMATAGEYVLKSGEKQVSFTIYTKEEYAKIISPLNTPEAVGSFYSKTYYPNAVGGEIAFDPEMKAYKYTFAENTSTSWYDHRIGLDANSAEFKRFEAGRFKYDYMAFDIYFDGTGGYNSDFYQFLILTTGTENKMAVAKEYYRLDFSQVTRVNASGNRVVIDEMRSGNWYTVYVPMAKDTELSVKSFCVMFAVTPLTKTENGETKIVQKDFWLRNLRFANSLPNA